MYSASSQLHLKGHINFMVNGHLPQAELSNSFWLR